VFSDFDGTIFLQDTGHILFDHHGCGVDTRKKLDSQIGTGERSFRSVSEELWASLDIPLEQGFETMQKYLVMDEGFVSFVQYCFDNNIPFNVISAGIKPLLRHVLDEFLGKEMSSQIGIISNDADIVQVAEEDGQKKYQWKPIWRHDTELGHDKAQSIQEFREHTTEEIKEADANDPSGPTYEELGIEESPLIIFIGDGVSDLPAAREADVLFARRGLLLEQYCIKNNLPYIPYDSFVDIQRDVEDIINRER
ncbi:hypothetical protein CANCADRAFT_14424, partial [Tortispora caseinolytica NRRL Y-17796]